MNIKRSISQFYTSKFLIIFHPEYMFRIRYLAYFNVLLGLLRKWSGAKRAKKWFFLLFRTFAETLIAAARSATSLIVPCWRLLLAPRDIVVANYCTSKFTSLYRDTEGMRMRVPAWVACNLEIVRDIGRRNREENKSFMHKTSKSNNVWNAFSHKGVFVGASAAKEVLFVASAEGAGEKLFWHFEWVVPQKDPK